MTEPQPSHWTENEETLEQYVLDHLSQLDRVNLERHLRGCAQCRERVRAERHLLGGIKQFGRATLKERVRSEVHASRFPRVPVQRVLSLAAMLLVVLGVGVLGIWLTRQQNQHPISEQKEVAQTPPPTEPGQVTNRETRPPLTGGEHEGSEFAQNESRSKPKSETQEMKRADKQKMTSASRPADSPSSAIDDVGLSGISATPDSTWIDGEVLDRYSGATEQMQARAKSTARDVPSTDHAQTPTPGPEFTLQVRRISELPTGRQRVQTGTIGDSVVSLLRKTRNGVLLTLYLDPRIDQTELQRAYVKVVNDSSLIVEADHLLIRYSVPPGWTTRQIPPAKPTR